MSGAAYNVGVHLSAVNGISGVLAVISKEVLGLNGSVEKLQKGFKGLKLGIIGAGLAGAGVGLLDAADHMEKAGEKLVHAQTALSAALPPATRAMSMQIANSAALNEISKNLNTTLSDNVEHLHDLYNVVQDMGEAAKLLPTFNTLQNAFQFVGAGDRGGSDIASAARAFELTGRTTPESLNAIGQEYVKSIIGLRGRVSGGNLLNVTQTAGGARYGWDDDFISKGLPALINVMGNRAGTGLYALFNNLYGGVSSSLAQAQGQEKYGLHTANQEQRDPRTGRFLGFKVGTIRNAGMLSSNPLAWANEYRGFLGGRGVDVSNTETMRAAVAEMSRGNKQLQALLDELLLPQPNRQLNKEMSNIGAVGDDALPNMKQNDPGAWRQAITSQWNSLEEQLGQTLVPELIDNVLKPLTNALLVLNQTDPGTLKDIANGMVVLGAALVGGGAVAIMAALGPAGWIAMGIIGLAGAIETHKSQLQNYFDKSGNGFGSGIGERQKWWDQQFATMGADIQHAYSQFFQEMGGFIRNDVLTLPGEVEGAISSAFSSIAAHIKAAVEAIPGEIGGFVGGLFHHSSYSPGAPPASQQPIHLQTAVNVDGRTLATATSQHLARLFTYPRQAPYPDGRSGWWPPDAQTVST